MRLGGRLQAAIEIIDDIQQRHRPAADALKDWGLSHRFAGSGDRAAIGNLVYDALRRKRSAAAMLGDKTSRSFIFGALLLSSAESVQSLDLAFEGDRFAPPPLTGSERTAIQNFTATTLPGPVSADIADWCVPELQSAFGEAWPDEAAALAARPPLDLRINTLKTTKDKVAAVLKRSRAKPCQLAPDGLRIAPIDGLGRHPNVQAEAAFQKGWFEVQDEGSQIVSMLAAETSSGQVLDYCAGAGGKTLALSAAYANKGQIFAYDAEKQRLAPIFERVKRGGCRNVQVLTDKSALTYLKDRMDMVLVDAPCTGSGTWRRRPDAKWRLTQRQLDQRRSEQTTILDEAAAFVKPGGSLVYITCSVFPSENEKQIEDFLSRSPGFFAEDHAALWNKKFPEHSDKVNFGRNGILLSPLKTGTDGFFFSALRRH